MTKVGASNPTHAAEVQAANSGFGTETRGGNTFIEVVIQQPTPDQSVHAAEVQAAAGGNGTETKGGNTFIAPAVVPAAKDNDQKDASECIYNSFENKAKLRDPSFHPSGI